MPIILISIYTKDLSWNWLTIRNGTFQWYWDLRTMRDRKIAKWAKFQRFRYKFNDSNGVISILLVFVTFSVNLCKLSVCNYSAITFLVFYVQINWYIRLSFLHSTYSLFNFHFFLTYGSQTEFLFFWIKHIQPSSMMKFIFLTDKLSNFADVDFVLIKQYFLVWNIWIFSYICQSVFSNTTTDNWWLKQV